MSPAKLSRRALLAAAGSAAGARALGRTPYAGQLRLTVPWPITRLDPATLDDAFSALFSAAVCDPLFALDAAGKPYPALANALPRAHADGVRVTLRSGLRTAAGKALSASDVLASLQRARSLGAAGLLGEVERPRADPKDPFSVIFPKANAEALGLLLASPLLAIVPRGFSVLAPDGTGAFRIELSPGRARLTRNPHAARGAAFLDAVEVSAVTELADLLRGFEAGSSDVGWFGSGLYRAVKDAVAFETPRYGFAVMMSGRLAGGWGAPGALQALVNAVPREQLGHLGLRGLNYQPEGSPRWGGPPGEILVPQAAPQLLATAQALSTALSSPGHELTIAEKPTAELGRLRDSKRFALLVDFVRSPGLSDREAGAALRTAVSPETAKRAPLTAPVAPRELGLTLPLAVVGELTIHGAHRTSLSGLQTWQLGGVAWRP